MPVRNAVVRKEITFKSINNPRSIINEFTNYYGIHLNKLIFEEDSSLSPAEHYTTVMKIKVLIFYI